LFANPSSARATGLGWIETLNLTTLATIALGREDLSSAEEHVRESLRVARNGLDPWSRAMAYNSLGDLLRARDDLNLAGPAYEEGTGALRIP
jgi:hypothetical protein